MFIQGSFLIFYNEFLMFPEMWGRCCWRWWSSDPATGAEFVPLQRPATQRQTTTPTTSWSVSIPDLFYFRFSTFPSVCVSTATFLFLPQNEPTFYTEDGTPFTAADPGESVGKHLEEQQRRHVFCLVYILTSAQGEGDLVHRLKCLRFSSALITSFSAAKLRYWHLFLLLLLFIKN